MLQAGLVFAALASLIHVYIFVLESLKWTEPKTMATFGITSPEAARTLQPMAYNQGFYNLFLAVVSVVGIVLALWGNRDAGVALVLAGTLSMTAAGVVLLLSSPDKRRAALIQLAAPGLAALCVVIWGLV